MGNCCAKSTLNDIRETKLNAFNAYYYYTLHWKWLCEARIIFNWISGHLFLALIWANLVEVLLLLNTTYWSLLCKIETLCRESESTYIVRLKTNENLSVRFGSEDSNRLRSKMSVRFTEKRRKAINVFLLV